MLPTPFSIIWNHLNARRSCKTMIEKLTEVTLRSAKLSTVYLLFSFIVLFLLHFQSWIHTNVLFFRNWWQSCSERAMWLFLGKSSHQRSRGRWSAVPQTYRTRRIQALIIIIRNTLCISVIIYETKMKRYHIPEIHTGGGRVDYGVVKDLDVLLNSEMAFTAQVDSIVQQMCGVLCYIHAESDISKNSGTHIVYGRRGRGATPPCKGTVSVTGSKFLRPHQTCYIQCTAHQQIGIFLMAIEYHSGRETVIVAFTEFSVLPTGKESVSLILKFSRRKVRHVKDMFGVIQKWSRLRPPEHCDSGSGLQRFACLV